MLCPRKTTLLLTFVENWCFSPTYSPVENVMLFLSANTKNKHSNYPASGVVAEILKLAVFWQTVIVDVVYVALWMVCSELGLSWFNIQPSFNLAMKHGMTHGLCIIVRGGGIYHICK